MVNGEFLTVINAHNGAAYRISKPIRFHNLAAFKSHLVTGLTGGALGSPDNAFIITPFGLRLNFLMINEMDELYLYDKRLFTVMDDGLILLYLHQADQADPDLKFTGVLNHGLKQLPSLWNKQSHVSWVKSVQVSREHLDREIDIAIRQVNNIFKSLNVVFQFAANFVSETEKNYNKYYSYVKLLTLKSLHKSWEAHYAELRQIPRLELHNGQTVTLALLLAELQLANSAALVSKHMPHVVDRFNEFSNTINETNAKKVDVDKVIERLRKESIAKFSSSDTVKRATQLQVDDLANKALQLAEEIKSGSQTLHEAELKVSNELYSKALVLQNLLQEVVQFRSYLAQSSLSVFVDVANLQLQMVTLKGRMKSLMAPSDKDEDKEDDLNYVIISRMKEAEDYLSLTIDLPLLLGFVLIERRRQIEWYSSYSKDIVGSTSVQLSSIIEHEKGFQKLWLKKFGNYLKYLNPRSNMRIQLPTIDVTLVNGGSSKRPDSVFAFLEDAEVTRDDLTSYVLMIRSGSLQNSAKFAELLEKNIKDLDVSTKNLRQASQVISSLSTFTPTQDGSVELETNADDQEKIKGLKSRIRKLEDLLHQQQFKNLSTWPVVKGTGQKSPELRQSMIMRSPSEPSSNPINMLLRHGSVLKRVSSDDASKVLDASATLDKHLDNIRLRRENEALSDRVEAAERTSRELQERIQTFEQKHRETEFKLKEKNRRIQDIERDFSEKDLIAQQTLESLGSKHEVELESVKQSHRETQTALEAEIAALRKEKEHLKERLEQKDHELAKAERLESEISGLTAELGDLTIMKDDLLSNMHAKEQDYANERSSLEKDLQVLRTQLEEKCEDYESLVDLMEQKHTSFDQVTEDLINCIFELVSFVSRLVASNIMYFEELCFILEAMGLLLVKEANADGEMEYKIKRVKGLRAKKGTSSMEDVGAPQIQTHVYSDITDLVTGLSEFIHEIHHVPAIQESLRAEQTEATTEEHDPSETRLKHITELIKTLLDKNSWLEEFLTKIAFKEHVQLQANDDEVLKKHFFLNGIAKRFSDVEGFAKKLTKENKSKHQNLLRSARLANQRISVGDFHEGDLALFLPTRTEGALSGWMAFNIDWPNYFLDEKCLENAGAKEWIVSRIKALTEHQVTEENQQGPENPFGLKAGTTWYNVETV